MASEITQSFIELLVQAYTKGNIKAVHGHITGPLWGGGGGIRR